MPGSLDTPAAAGPHGRQPTLGPLCRVFRTIGIQLCMCIRRKSYINFVYVSKSEKNKPNNELGLQFEFSALTSSCTHAYVRTHAAPCLPPSVYTHTHARGDVRSAVVAGDLLLLLEASGCNLQELRLRRFRV